MIYRFGGFARAMNRAQRVVLILYCLLLVYCCIWIPWRIQIQVHVPSDSYRAGPAGYYRAGYGWSWAGPRETRYDAAYAAPDILLLQLRLSAVTSVALAAFLLSGMLPRPASS
jgi:hypothetical protein